MKALSIWQPWAWLIVHGGKDIENRGWSTWHRGPLLIHASKKAPRQQDIDAIALWMGERKLDEVAKAMLKVVQWDLGGIIGRVDLVDCVRGHLSTWADNGYLATDTWHLVLANPVALPFRPLRGERGLFEVNAEEVSIPAAEGPVDTCRACRWCEVSTISITSQGLADELVCVVDPLDPRERRWKYPRITRETPACPRFSRKAP